MARIIPIRDLRNTAKIAEMCASSPEPVYITRNGYGEMVIMSMEAYEDSLAGIKLLNEKMSEKSEDEKPLLKKAFGKADKTDGEQQSE